MCGFRLNCSRPSHEAIKNQQLGAIDGVSLKERRLFGQKAIDHLETSFARAPSLITSHHMRRKLKMVQHGPRVKSTLFNANSKRETL